MNVRAVPEARATALHPPGLPPPGEPISLRYSLARDRVPVRIAVYDARGILVWSHRQAAVPAGEHTVTWNRRDRRENTAARGIYLVLLDAGGTQVSRKLALLHR